MSTPSPRYICPQCSASYDSEMRYCGRCGADMTRASALEHAARHRDDAGGGGSGGGGGLAAAATAEQVAIREGRPRERASIAPAPERGDIGGETNGRALAVESGDGDGTGDDDWGAHDRRVATSKRTWLSKVIDGRYRVIEVIGRGGMGVVYKVEHQRMGKIAAMKVLHTDLAHEPEVLERFRREAEAVSRLDHPNTVQVFDFGTADGAMYLIMEYVKGQDLGAVVERDGPLPFSRGAPLFAQICAALAEAHALGVVHRDLKPENILVTRTQSGRDFVKVLDFGLAKVAERGEPSGVTDRSEIVGTPYFMAPEQIRGEEVDARSDVYSLGSLMYKVLTGEHAYTAKSAVGVLTKHLTCALEMPSVRASQAGVDIDADPLVWDRVDGIIARCMAKAPAHRFQSASELLDEIEGAWSECYGEGSPSRLPAMRPARRPEVATDAPDGQVDASRATGAAPQLHGPDSVDYGIDSRVRLRRSDLDAYEQSLRRWRWMGIAAVPLMLVVAAGVAYWLLHRPAQPLEAEREPNDQIAGANPVAAGATFRGFIGRRASKNEPDRDYVRLLRPDGGEAGFVVSAHLTALPNVDLELALYDGAGSRIVVVDEHGAGVDEWLRRRAVSGTVYAVVTEAMHGELRLPTENVSDRYELTLTIETADPGLETEPDDGDADALSLTAGGAIAGWLDERDDVDCYRVAEGGRYRLGLEADAALPVAWRIDDGLASSAREQSLELRAGAVIRLWRTDAQLASPPAPALPGDYRLVLRR